jgi:hypothetical protein
MTAIVPDDLKAILDHLIRLDTRLDGMDVRLRNLEVTVARMDGRLSQMPNLMQTIGIMLTIMFGTFGGFAALLAVARYLS